MKYIEGCKDGYVKSLHDNFCSYSCGIGYKGHHFILIFQKFIGKNLHRNSQLW